VEKSKKNSSGAPNIFSAISSNQATLALSLNQNGKAELLADHRRTSTSFFLDNILKIKGGSLNQSLYLECFMEFLTVYWRMTCNFYLVQSYSSHSGINVSDASTYIFVRKKLLYVELSSFSIFFCKIILIKRQYDHSLILDRTEQHTIKW